MTKLTQLMAFFVFLGTTLLLSLGLLFILTAFSYGMTDGASFTWLSKGRMHPQSETAYSSIEPDDDLDQYTLRELDYCQPSKNFVDGDYLGFGEDFSVNLAEGYKTPLK